MKTRLSIRFAGLGSIALVAALQSIAWGGAETPTQQKMLRELDSIQNVFESLYAPVLWKEKFTGWKLGVELDRARQQVRSGNLSAKAFQYTLRDFFVSTKDYHVSVSFHSTEQASLPFTVKGAEGRLFLAYVDRAKLPEESFPVQLGDELIQFDGSAPREWIDAFVKRVGNVEETDRARAELLLTSRQAAAGLPVPHGPVTVVFKRKTNDKLITLQLAWDYVPEKVKPSSLAQAPLNDSIQSQATAREIPSTTRLMIGGDLDGLMADAADVNPFLLGGRKSYLPVLGNKLWSSKPEDIFDAYIYQASDRRLIGYVRIPSYVPADAPKAVAEFAQLVARFQGATDALVIDQINNPGGSVFYLYALASLLSDQPLKAPKHRVTITQSEVSEAQDTLLTLSKVTDDASAKKIFGDTISGFPVTYELARFAKGFSEFIISEWNAGRTFSEPTYLWAVDHINPYPGVQYTKPILLVVNALDFSGGDFFPAILQDNKRVTVFGTRTAGAGGYVIEVKYPNLFGIAKYRATGSIAERADLNPIENLGIKPDVQYSLSVKDLQAGYSGYAAAIRENVSKLIR